MHWQRTTVWYLLLSMSLFIIEIEIYYIFTMASDAAELQELQELQELRLSYQYIITELRDYNRTVMQINKKIDKKIQEQKEIKIKISEIEASILNKQFNELKISNIINDNESLIIMKCIMRINSSQQKPEYQRIVKYLAFIKDKYPGIKLTNVSISSTLDRDPPVIQAYKYSFIDINGINIDTYN